MKVSGIRSYVTSFKSNQQNVQPEPKVNAQTTQELNEAQKNPKDFNQPLAGLISPKRPPKRPIPTTQPPLAGLISPQPLPKRPKVNPPLAGLIAPTNLPKSPKTPEPIRTAGIIAPPKKELPKVEPEKEPEIKPEIKPEKEVEKETEIKPEIKPEKEPEKTEK